MTVSVIGEIKEETTTTIKFSILFTNNISNNQDITIDRRAHPHRIFKQNNKKYIQTQLKNNLKITELVKPYTMKEKNSLKYKQYTIRRLFFNNYKSKIVRNIPFEKQNNSFLKLIEKEVYNVFPSENFIEINRQFVFLIRAWKAYDNSLNIRKSKDRKEAQLIKSKNEQVNTPERKR
jgi:hypothetical protein